MLDWERFQRIIQPNQEHNLSSLKLILDESEFVIDFLKQLSMELKQLNSIGECVKLFPFANTHLTAAAVHPYIGYNKVIVQLLMTCLMEYSKFSEDLITTNNAVNEFNESIEKKSTLWCIIRLRRLMSCNIPNKVDDSSTTLIQKQIQRISNILETKGNKLSNQCITELTNACLGLLDQSIETASLIEKLVSLAVPFNNRDDNIHFDKKIPCLSNQFLYQLIQSSSKLRDLYQTWPPKLKASLWLQYNDILEMELLDLIEEYTQESYISKQTLSQHIQQHPLITTAKQYHVVHQRITFNLADFIVTSFCDYRLLKFNLCIQPHLGITSESPKDLYQDFQNYIYDGSIEEVEKRRNVAWCYALGLWDMMFLAVVHIVDWCRGNELWTKEMEDTIMYINWLICPSLDNREYESLSLLRYWLQSNQDANDHSKFYHSLSLQWRQIFRENKIVLACFITVIIGSPTTQFTADQKTSLVNSVIIVKQSTNNGNSTVVDLNVAYCILDFLNEIKEKKPLCINDTDVDKLINHVYKHI